MSIVINVLAPKLCTNPLARFGPGPGAEFLELFQAGAVLHVYRGISPHNWWLAHPDGWKIHFDRGVEMTRALVSFADRKRWAGIVPYSDFGVYSEGGMPMEEAWTYSARKLELQKKRWSQALQCAADWGACAGKFTGNLRLLSETGRATLRTLQKQFRLPMYPELIPVWQELNEHGLIRVRPEGEVRMAVAGRILEVSPGPLLQVFELQPTQP